MKYIINMCHQDPFYFYVGQPVDSITGSAVNQFNIKDEILKDSSSDSDFSLLSFQI